MNATEARQITSARQSKREGGLRAALAWARAQIRSASVRGFDKTKLGLSDFPELTEAVMACLRDDGFDVIDLGDDTIGISW